MHGVGIVPAAPTCSRRPIDSVRRKMRRRTRTLLAAAGVAVAACGPPPASGPEVVELDLASIREGLRTGSFTCSELVEA